MIQHKTGVPTGREKKQCEKHGALRSMSQCPVLRDWLRIAEIQFLSRRSAVAVVEYKAAPARFAKR